MMSATISQLSCLSSVSRGLHFRLQSRSLPTFRPKCLIAMSSDEHATDLSRSELKTVLSYKADATEYQNGSSLKSYPPVEPVTMNGETKPIEEPAIAQQKRAAKIHDFCLGIPFAGIVLEVNAFPRSSRHKDRVLKLWTRISS